MQKEWISIRKFGILSKAEADEKFSRRVAQGNEVEIENMV